MVRVLGLDVGERRVGVAVSDPLGITAQAIETIISKGWTEDIRRIATIASEYGTDRILIGLPYSMSGNAGVQAQTIQKFGDRLASKGFSIRYQDERLTTASARRALIEGGVRREKRKGVIDKIAAVLILQNFLDAGGWREEDNPIVKGKIWRYRAMDGNLEQDNIVELYDEDGNVVRFEHLMTLEHQGENYVLVAAAEPTDDLSEDEIVILKITVDEEGEDAYIGVEDEALCEEIYAQYLEIAEADEDGEEE